jgi:hypothetical protein
MPGSTRGRRVGEVGVAPEESAEQDLEREDDATNRRGDRGHRELAAAAGHQKRAVEGGRRGRR